MFSFPQMSNSHVKMLWLVNLEKFSLRLSSLIVIHVNLFIIISLVFFYLSQLLFSGFLQFKGHFVHVCGQKLKML